MPVSEFQTLKTADDMLSQHYIPLSNPDILAVREHPTSIFLPQSGINARYWIYDSNAPCTDILVLVHGFRGDHHGLLPIVEHLDHYRILAVDLPGFGEAEPLKTAKHDVNGYIGFLKEFLDILRKPSIAGKKPADSYTLLGHSFGSIIASHLAAQYPHDIDNLILINPISAPALEGPQRLLSALALSYYRLCARLPEKIGLFLLQNPVITYMTSILMTKTQDASLKRLIKDQHRAYFSTFANRKIVLEAFESSISETAYTVASRISLPTLLIAGKQDDMTSLESQHTLKESFQGPAFLKIIDDVGHLIHYEKSYEAAQAIDSFLKNYRGAHSKDL